MSLPRIDTDRGQTERYKSLMEPVRHAASLKYDTHRRRAESCQLTKDRSGISGDLRSKDNRPGIVPYSNCSLVLRDIEPYKVSHLLILALPVAESIVRSKSTSINYTE